MKGADESIFGQPGKSARLLTATAAGTANILLLTILTLARDPAAVRASSPGALVTVGVFSRRRHPSEAGLLAIGLGTTILLESGFGFLVWLMVLVPLVIYRTCREDALLTLAFGHRYRKYATRVRALI